MGQTTVRIERALWRRVNTAAGQTVIGLAAAVVLVFAFLHVVDLPSVFRRLEDLSIVPALLCGVVFLGAFAVRALRWRFLLAPDAVSVPRVVAIYLVAMFVNVVLPVRGGELVKSLLLRRLNGIPISRSLPTVAMDKALDLLPVVALLAVAPFLPYHLGRTLWALLVSMLVVLCGVALFLALAAWQREMALALLAWATARLPLRLRLRVEPFTIRFVDALLGLMRRPRTMLIAAACTVVAVCLDALFFQLAFRAVGASIPFPIVLYGYTFYNLAYILPTPPGQIGSNELVGLLVFSGLLNINRSVVAAVFLFSHPWTIFLMACASLVSLSVMGLSLRSTFALPRVSLESASASTSAPDLATAGNHPVREPVPDAESTPQPG